MNCLWSDLAETELNKVAEYITDNFGIQPALEFLSKIEQWDAWLAENPEMARREPVLLSMRKHEYRRSLGHASSPSATGGAYKVAERIKTKQSPIFDIIFAFKFPKHTDIYNEFCMIVLLSYDNKDLHHDRAKYVTVRNWSLVEGDKATINKFDYVDFIYSDVKYRKDDIDALQETIRMKYDIMMEKKQKHLSQKRRK